MEKLFYPQSIVIIGLSSKTNNIPRLILENLLRWGYRGRIFGVNPKCDELNVSGIKMYKEIEDLPEVPDLAACLIPARFVPESVEKCGRFGIRHMAVLSGGFSEFGEGGEKLSEVLLNTARKHNIRFVGPNALATANTANGLCLPFIPIFPRPEVDVHDHQSGVWTYAGTACRRNVGRPVCRIGNKIDLDESNFHSLLIEDQEGILLHVS
jgi:acetyltransferase